MTEKQKLIDVLQQLIKDVSTDKLKTFVGFTVDYNKKINILKCSLDKSTWNELIGTLEYLKFLCLKELEEIDKDSKNEL